MTPKPRARQLADEAKFVFQGSVKKVKASTLKGVPKSDRTVVVRIDRVIQAPEALSDHAGRDVTVLLASFAAMAGVISLVRLPSRRSGDAKDASA